MDVSHNREPLCNHCGFSVRRGVVPIIWPGNEGKMKAYCGIECWEAVAKSPFPFNRPAHIAAERGA